MNERVPRVLLALPRYRGPNHGLFLGLAGLAGALRQDGAEVAVLDEDVAARAEELGDESPDTVLQRVVSGFKPTLVGVHINTPSYAAGLDLAVRLRAATDAPIVAGGPHASAAADVVLRRHAEVDYVLRGEADVTLPELARRLVTCSDLSAVPGLSRRLGGHPVHNPRAPLVPPQAFPHHDRKALLFPADPVLSRHARARYRESFAAFIPGFGGREVAGIYASRGCTASCPFCSPSAFWAEPDTGRPVRRVRPVEHVVSELGEIRDLGYGAVFFDEPTFPMASEPAWLAAFCREVMPLGLVWGAPTRLEELDPRLLPDLARAGLRYVYFGLETPVPRLLRAMDKPADLQRAHAVLAACERAGIQCDVALFFGAPGETDETVTATLEWIDRHLPHGNAFFSVAAFWPGTPWSERQGLDPAFWEPDHDHGAALARGAVWYPESAVSIERFYSNSTGTYHPAFMSIDRALAIKERIVCSGFRERFSRHARTTRHAAGGI